MNNDDDHSCPVTREDVLDCCKKMKWTPRWVVKRVLGTIAVVAFYTSQIDCVLLLKCPFWS